MCSESLHLSIFLHVKHIVIKRHNSTNAFRRPTLQHVLIWIFVMSPPLFSMIWTFCKYDDIGCPSPCLFFPVPELKGQNFSSNPSKHDFTNHDFEDCSLEHSLPGMSLHLQLSAFLYNLFTVGLKGCELRTFFLFKSLSFWNSFENNYS